MAGMAEARFGGAEDSHAASSGETGAKEPAEIFAFPGSSRLARAIGGFDIRCVAVHGHAQRGRLKCQMPRGVPVCIGTRNRVSEQVGRR